MIDTIEKIGELVENTPDIEVPIISYYEWLSCFNNFITRIKNNDTDAPDFFYNGELLRLVSPDYEKMSEAEYKEYRRYTDLIMKFSRAYNHAANYYNNYQANAKEVLEKVLNGTAEYGDADGYRPIK